MKPQGFLSVNKPPTAQAITITAEEFERYSRRGGGPREDGPPNWLRRQARAELETRMNAHNGQRIELADIFNHRAEGRRLEALFDRVVNGTGRDANRAALYVLAHYRLGVVS